ncbi:MAG: hypothetical protein QOI41_6047 [Myxococcales bacterium]|nr:hypothetical protein [Myxococcales bacterium]
MKDPNRLSADGSSYEKTLLRSSRTEEPSRALEQRVLAALAVPPRAEAAEPSNGSPEPGLARFLTPRGIVMAVAAMGVAAAVAGSIGARREAAPPPSPPSAAPFAAPLVPAAEVPPPPAAANEGRAELVVTPDSLPNVVAAPPSARASAAARAAAVPAAAAPSIEREIELLDAVKSKLGAGSPNDAARALDAYDAEFPQGVLRPEGTVLRVRTLLLQGNRAAATKLADEFLAAHPGSVHGKRMRALLAE